MTSTTSEADALAMVRLVVETIALHADHQTGKRYLINGLKSMIGADCWAWMLSPFPPGRPAAYISIQQDGFGDERFARYLRAFEHPDMDLLTAPLAQGLMTQAYYVTRARGDISGAGEFLSADARSLWLAADIEPLILLVQLEGQRLSTIGLFRRANQPSFDARESSIARILLSEIPWLHTTGW